MNRKEEKGVFRKLEPVPQEDRITGEEVVEIWFAPQAGEDGRYTGERRTAFSLGPSIGGGVTSAQKNGEIIMPRK